MNEKRFTTIDGVRLASWACAFFVVAGFFLLVAAFGVGCQEVPAPEPHTALHDGFNIVSCQEVGRAAKADGGPDAGWQAYDICMTMAGYRDGGADGR